MKRWLTTRREHAASEWLETLRLAKLLQGAPIGVHAAADERRARRHLLLWDTILDLWTQRERHRTTS